MKTIKKTLLLVLLITVSFSCDNDDGNAPNENVCTYEGLTFEDPNNNTNILIPEADLQTEYFPNNGGPGIPAVEIYETSNPGNLWFLTDVVTLNATGTGTIGIGGTNYPCTVICQRAGTQVGEEMRFDVVFNGGNEAEFCVVIDSVNP
ncbi:hypothetical protein [Winogradskyella sp.]|jgi:hypothetical protein|uniref:hypothetical protein n=1 Tax=Winogradskyella sp. TaxID=1883156 RepID=UPI0025F5271F|nr:hypothetical protein [Winogradskyella sp.]MCT4630978.1 hypothetical protein [Winogradskyella sp.]